MGASAAAGPRRGEAESADTPTLSVVLQKQTGFRLRERPYRLQWSLQPQYEQHPDSLSLLRVLQVVELKR